MTNIELKQELQKEAEEAHLKIGKKSTICAGVGSGKSVIAINRIKSYLKLKRKPQNIIFAGARELYLSTFKQELIKWDLEEEISKITFCCVASLKNYTDKDWDLIIIDESHLDVERIISFLHFYKNKNTEILLLTGTPLKEDSEIGKQLYKICPISYRKSLDDSISQTIVNDYRIRIIYHKLDDEDKYIKYGNFFQSENNKYNFLYKCYLNSFSQGRKKFPFELMQLKQFFKNLKSKEQIANLLLSKIKGKVLVYAGNIEQCDRIGTFCYHSSMLKANREYNLKNFIDGNIDVLFNVNGIRESANIPNLKYGIIMAPDASPNAFEQIIGRFSRLLIGEIAEVVVLCAKNTVEEQWLNGAMRKLDKNKISKINLEEIEILYK